MVFRVWHSFFFFLFPQPISTKVFLPDPFSFRVSSKKLPPSVLSSGVYSMLFVFFFLSHPSSSPSPLVRHGVTRTWT